MVEAANNHLISTDALATLMANGHPVCILDCTVVMPPGSAEDPAITHSKEHIHGSKFLDLRLTRDVASPYPMMMPPKEYFVMLCKSFDIRKSHTVVCYDTQQSNFAHRAAFMFRAYGHPDVRVLDGGLAKWKAEGKEVHSKKAPHPKDEDFAFELKDTEIKQFEDVVEISQKGTHQLIDCRPAPGYQAGNIPSSVNVPAPSLANPDGTLKSPEEIKVIFENAGIDLSKPMVFTCGGGVMATVGKHAAEHAGATGEKAVYDGSWTEYSVRAKK